MTIHIFYNFILNYRFVRFIGRIPIEIFIVSPVAITLGVLYFMYNHWIILDSMYKFLVFKITLFVFPINSLIVFSLSIVAFSLSVLRVTNLKVSLIMLTFFLYMICFGYLHQVYYLNKM